MSLYDDLGVDQETSKGALRRAFKHKANKTHPDKEGGNTEAFKVIQKAYSILSNSEKKKRYDETGQTNTLPPLRKQAVDIIAKIYIEEIQKNQFKKKDYLVIVRIALVEAIKADKSSLSKIQIDHDALVYLIDNTTGDKMLMDILNDQVKHMKQHRNKCSDHLAILEDAILCMASCSYNGDEDVIENIGGFTTTVHMSNFYTGA